MSLILVLVSTEQELPEMYEDVTLKVLHTRVPVEVAVSSTHLRVTTVSSPCP